MEDRKDIAFALIKPDTQEFTDEDIKKVETEANELQNEMRRVFQGKVLVKVTPYTYHADTGYSLESFDYRKFKLYCNEVNPENTHNYWHVGGGFGSTFCGKAGIGARTAFSYPNCWYKGTVIHEQFHNFGLHHEGTPANEYGGASWMGRNALRDDLVAPHVYRLDLIEEEHIEDLLPGESAMIPLCRATTVDGAIPVNMKKIVLVRNETHPKLMSVSFFKGGVDIHVPFYENSTSLSQITRIERITTEGLILLDNGVTVEVTDLNDHDATVLVHNGESGIPELVEPEYPEYDVRFDLSNAGGVWGNPDWTVQGIHLHPLPDRNECLVYWFTWDYEGNQRFYYSTMSIREGAAYGELYTTENRVPVKVGDVYLELDSEATGRIMATTDLGYTYIPLTRYLLGTDHELNGYWGLGNNEGLSLNVNLDTDTGEQIVVGYWMTYDTKGNQQWKYIQGPYDKPLTIYELSGGVREVETNHDIVAVGTARINDGSFILPDSTRELTQLA